MRHATGLWRVRLCILAAMAFLGGDATGVARTPTFVPMDPLTLGDPPCATQLPGFTLEQEDDTQILLDALTAGNPVPAGVQTLSLTISPGGASRVGVFSDFNLEHPMGSPSPTYSMTMPDGVVMTTGYLDQVPSGDLGRCNLYEDLSLDLGLYVEDPDLKNLFASDPDNGVYPPDLYDGVSIGLHFSSDISIGAVRFKVVLGSDEFPFYAETQPIPRSKQRQAQQDLQENLIPGAEVMTSFGLFATVMSIDDETNVATIDAGSGTVLRVHLQVLTKIVQDEPEALEEPAESSADDAGRESRDS